MSVAKHPVQFTAPRRTPLVPTTITLQAYEVYKHLYGEQEALARGERGGFHLGELLVYLYAYPHPRDQWHRLVREASAGMENLT